ncbi:MAG TPA: NAD(P)/FAD-dependent oxidoreductase [Myxococcota bacterium]|nr:NAD(P)/FAD-dependent oxidoreductase [Myxococcota bacterium]
MVIGAGFSGIGAGIQLKKAGIDSFVILEQAGDIGGTWRDNTYPGVAVDITSFTYSFSFEQNPDWSRVFAPGRELKAYADHCADKYGLRPHLRLGTKLERMVFDSTRHLWVIQTPQGSLTARFVISGTGALTQPKLPAIDGIDEFEGMIMHTARWDHGYDLTGKRVAVIGTGATGVQVIPALAPIVEHLDVYQRTPIWILPKPDAAIPPRLRHWFRRFPVVQRCFRMLTSALTEILMTLGIVYNRQVPWLLRRIQRLCLDHLHRQVPDPELRNKLTPQYRFGCKRPSFSDEYFPAFLRDNVKLITEPIDRITRTGIETEDGKRRPIDALILATGFRVYEKGNLPPYEIFGSEGQELGRFWEEQRYQAYEGATVPGFPNYFMVVGPYSASGSSWFSMIEAQVAHALRCIREAHRRRATLVEVKHEVHDRYFHRILRRQKNTVFFNNDCSGANSYYFDRHGDAPFLRPSSGLEMWWHSRHFDLDHYRFV